VDECPDAAGVGGGATKLLLGSGDWLTVIPVLRELADRLLSIGYGRTEVLPLAGSLADVCFDPVNLARLVRGRLNLFHRSALAGGFAAGLGWVAGLR
jgi:hypothetical protein